MPDITAPEALQYARDVRGLAHKLRAFKAELKSMRARYDGGAGNFFYGHETEIVADGRTDGVPTITGGNVSEFNTRVQYELLAELDRNGAALDAMLERLCVFPLRAE